MGHNDIVKVLCSEIERAGGKAWTEPRFLLHHADDEHTDIRFSLGGQLVYVDVTVVHPTAATYLARATQGPLRAAASAEAAKNRQYLARAEQENAQFFPFVVETYGGFGKLARQLVKLISDHASGASALFSPADIRQAIQRGVHHKLQLRNLRLMTAQLNLAHRPPPRRTAPSGPAPRVPTPAAPGPVPRGPPPGPPPRQPAGPPRDRPRGPSGTQPRAPQAASRRSRLTVTHDGVSRSSTLTITAVDTSFDRLIAEANAELGLGLVPLGHPASADAATSRACAARPSALAEQSPLLASELLSLPAETAPSLCTSDALITSPARAAASHAPCDASATSQAPVTRLSALAEQSLLLASDTISLPVDIAAASCVDDGSPATCDASANQVLPPPAACPRPSAVADVTMASFSPGPAQD